jgi:uncharacterized protein YgiM (DUF1202 family)
MLAALIAVLGGSASWNASSAMAQDEVTAAAIMPGSNAVVDDGPLNQRATASTSGTIVQVLATGTLVSVISGPTSANGYNWWYVTANAVNGYVAGQFLEEIGFVVGDDVAVTSNNVNVRSGPGTTFSIIDQLNTGDIGEVIGGPTTANGYAWYQLQYETSLTGWVASAYLALSSTPPPSGGFGVNSWILVDDPPVNMRSGAGTNFSIILSLNSNQAVKVTGTPTNAGGYTWYPVRTPGGTNGYVVGSFFEGGLFQNDYATVADGPLNLRATASNSGTILTTIPTNASIYINGNTPVYAGGQSWFNVTYNGTTGWAAGSYLAPA